MATDPNRLPPLPPGFVLDGQAAGGGLTPIIPRTPAPQTPARAAKDRLDVDNARLTGIKLQQEIDDKNPGRKEQKNAISLLTAAGVDLERNVDPITDLIKGSTSGYLEYGAAELKGAVTGDATPGMENIAKLKTLVSDMTLQLTGGSLGSQISNSDREFIMQRVGNLGDATRPADERLAAWEQVKQRMANITGVKYTPPAKGRFGDDFGAPGTEIQFKDSVPEPPVNPLNPEQRAAYDAFWKANPKANAEQLKAFMVSMGTPLAPNGPGSAEDIIRARDAGAGVAPGSSALFVEPDISDKRGKGGFGESVDAVVRGAANVVPFMDEISAAGNTVFGEGSYRENLNREQAIDQYDWEKNTPEVIAGTILGGVTIPTKAPKVYHAARSEALAAGATEKAAHVAGRSAFARQIAKEGGTYGTVYGAGSEGDLGDRAANAATGGVVGAATGFVGGKAFGPRAPKPSAPGPAPTDVARALQEEGIAAARPIADPTVRGKMSYLETTRGGHNPVRDALDETRVGIADKVAGLKGAGENKTSGGMGELVQEAGKGAIKTMKDRAGRTLDRAARRAADNPVTAKEALTKLDEHISTLERNPNTNRGVLSYLKSVRKDFDGQKTVADIRDIRTGMNGEINRRNLGKSNAERIMGEVLVAARNDITRDLASANPTALKLYQRGDDMWGKMATERKQVLERIVGPADNPLSGEETVKRIRAMMGNKGDLGRFKRVMNMLDPEDRDNFAATLIEGIGQKSAEEPFSPAIFLANTRDMQPDALKAVFGDKGARSIMNLRVASRAFTDTVGSLNNSRSGFVANFKDIVASVSNLRSGGAGALGFMAGGLPGAVAGAVAGEAIQRGLNYLSAKTLMNTDVSQWVRAASKAKTKAEAQGLVGKLGGIASRNPAISQEITGLREFLVRAANDNMTPKLAAEQANQQDNR